MTDFVPDRDLNEVCRNLGIPDWRKIQLNPEGAPDRYLRESQLTGK
ncbi:hypothetical protein FNYG_14236 [Fusarium nygamai]|uniref:Uncharacterized protein n=1 Tax=Gibberella nygamai TaxID=42673 RepID=A0A2K0UTR0_GIBNY|nr:hypothetical protein FNYG_14236 [Fusarium nygamai]